jgi:DNA repair protein RadC
VDFSVKSNRLPPGRRAEKDYRSNGGGGDQPLTYRHWRLPNRKAVFDYVHSLGDEAFEWLCALYVDEGLNLLAVETICVGDPDSVKLDFGAIICRGRAHGAAGFILVHNHPSGDPRPSKADKQATARLRFVSEQMEMPLLDHFIVAGDRMESVGHW